MKRFSMFVGVAVVAAAMYVATSQASQQVRFAPEPQVIALEKKVTTLNNTLKMTKKEADAAVGIIGACYLNTSGSTANIVDMPVSQFGNTSSGFLFGNSGSSTPRTALDINTASPQAYLQQVNSACVSGAALRHGAVRSGIARFELWAERTR
jgi:hypothetical protein